MKSFSLDVSAALQENFCFSCGLSVQIFPESPTARAAIRFFGLLLSDLTMYIGYMMVAFDPQRRALHDYIADTRVIKRDRPAEKS